MTTTTKIENVLGHVNQFSYTDNEKSVFQSYNSICAIVDFKKHEITLWRDRDFSKTTLKHLKAFLCFSWSKQDLEKALKIWELRGMKLTYNGDLA